jgi:hypothetical protein
MLFDPEYERLSRSEARLIGTVLGDDGADGYVVRRVLEDGSTVGAVIVVPIADGDEKDFREDAAVDLTRDVLGRARIG